MLATTIFARTEVMGVERLEYELTPEAIELGLDAALPATFELTGTIGEFGRGERDSPFLTHVPAPSPRFVLVNTDAGGGGPRLAVARSA